MVDGDWVIDPNAPLETDSSGIQNNILSAQTIQEAAQQDMPPATISSVNPESTTAALAAVVPKEDEPPVATLSSVAPDSSTAALAGQVPLENAAPGTDALAVETADPASPAPATASVPDDNQIFSVNPLPASDTAENPISLQPGEPVPKNIGTQSLHSNVRLDKESYERGATNFPLDVVTPADLGVSSLPKNLIPESSLPITSASEAAAAKPKPAEVPAKPSATTGVAAVATGLASTPAVADAPVAAEESAPQAGSQTAPAANGIQAKTTATHNIVLNKPEPERQPFVRENVVAAEAAVPSSAAVVDKKDKAEVQPAPAVATANGSGNGIKPTPPKAEPVMAAPTEPVSNGQHPKTSTEAGRASVGSSSKKNKRRSFFGKLKDRFF